MDTASSAIQVVPDEDTSAEVTRLRQALRDHALHCDLRVMPHGEAVETFMDGPDMDGKTQLAGSSPGGPAPAESDGAETLRHFRGHDRCGQPPAR